MMYVFHVNLENKGIGIEWNYPITFVTYIILDVMLFWILFINMYSAAEADPTYPSWWQQSCNCSHPYSLHVRYLTMVTDSVYCFWSQCDYLSF